MYNEGLSDASKLEWKTKGSTTWKGTSGGIYGSKPESAW
jgi:hypothetical protein